MKKIAQYLQTGLAIGFVLTTVFSTISSGINDFTAQIIAWCIASAIYGVSSMVFEIESLNTLAASIMHYAICAITTTVNVIIFYQPYAISVFASFTITYIAIYLVFWQIEKQKIKKLNAKLQEK